MISYTEIKGLKRWYLATSRDVMSLTDRARNYWQANNSELARRKLSEARWLIRYHENELGENGFSPEEIVKWTGGIRKYVSRVKQLVKAARRLEGAA